MSMMIIADDAVSDNRWWRELFRIYAKPGEYFEIHCWSDEKKEFLLAEEFGEPACYSLPDIKIIHGTMTDRMISYLLYGSKPVDSQCYNKMVPFFTIRIGNHFSSEKYGTEIILQSRSLQEKELITKILSDAGQGISVFFNK